MKERKSFRVYENTHTHKDKQLAQNERLLTIMTNRNLANEPNNCQTKPGLIREFSNRFYRIFFHRSEINDKRPCPASAFLYITIYVLPLYIMSFSSVDLARPPSESYEATNICNEHLSRIASLPRPNRVSTGSMTSTIQAVRRRIF